MNLQQVTQALNGQINNVGGVEVAELMCSRMYSQKFRTEPMKIKDYFVDYYDKGESMAEFIRDSEESKILSQYLKSTGRQLPVEPETLYPENEGDYEYCEMANDANFDHYYGQVESLLEEAKKHVSVTPITPEDLMVVLCNYKGEGEGEALACLSENLPVFRSKNDSFYQANLI